MKGVNDLEKFMGQVDHVKVPGDIGDVGGSIDQVGRMDALKEKDNSKVEVKSRMKFRWTKRNLRTNGRRFGGFRIAISRETRAATSTPRHCAAAEAGSTMETDALLQVQRMACCGSGSRQCSGPTAAPAEGIAAMALLFHFEPWRQNA